MGFTFALVGNPNSGKTTMFNEITGSTQYVGNWPGVTVEKKEGKARKFNEDIKIVDLPGIYSLSPYSLEEVIARDYIIDEKPDVVINIVDASNIERNLYLTLQLKELGVPVVAAFNMMDIVKAKGEEIDLQGLEKQLGIPVVPTSASKGKGIRETVEKALQIAQTSLKQGSQVQSITFDDGIEKCIQKIQEIIPDSLSSKVYNDKWLALKLLEQDENVLKKFNISDSLVSKVKPYIEELENKYDSDVETIIADNRYGFISDVVSKTVTKKRDRGELTTSDKIDKIVTNRILAIPIFLVVMYVMFWVCFDEIGSKTIEWMEWIVGDVVGATLSGWIVSIAAPEWLHALIIDGIIWGVGAVVIYIPQIMILFFFISLLEDSGYMARAAFVMDKLFRKFGLTGKSFIPMLMGFGCSVPGIMAARTLENEKDRKLTILLTPFMSCGAKLPIYALFTAAFFASNRSLVVFSIYILGIVVAIISGIVLKNTVFKGEAAPFVMELPPYRIPTLKGLFIHMWDRAKAFIKKAGTVIFGAAVLIWFLQAFNFSFSMVDDVGESILAAIGRVIAPIFTPLGFGDWKSSVALLTGLVAKEVVVGTLGILNGLGEVGENSVELITKMQTYFTPIKAYAFMAFSLLYVPCIAALGVMKREFNSWKLTFLAAAYQIGVAWIVVFIIFQVGSLLGLG